MTDAQGFKPLDKGAADLVDVIESKEPWAEYTLEDGAVVRVRNLVVEVWKDRVQRDADGHFIYHVSMAPIINIQPPKTTSTKAATKRRARK